MALHEARLRQAVDAKLPADAFLQKPLHLHALKPCLARHIGRAGARFDLASDTVPVD